MAREIPEVVRAAAGLAATVLDEARKLPETLPGLPVRLIGLAMQQAMKVQQQYAGFVARGDELFTGLRGEDEPGLATFDDDEPPLAPAGFRDSAFDRAGDTEPTSASADLIIDEEVADDAVVDAAAEELAVAELGEQIDAAQQSIDVLAEEAPDTEAILDEIAIDELVDQAPTLEETAPTVKATARATKAAAKKASAKKAPEDKAPAKKASTKKAAAKKAPAKKATAGTPATAPASLAVSGAEDAAVTEDPAALESALLEAAIAAPGASGAADSPTAEPSAPDTVNADTIDADTIDAVPTADVATTVDVLTPAGDVEAVEATVTDEGVAAPETTQDVAPVAVPEAPADDAASEGERGTATVESTPPTDEPQGGSDLSGSQAAGTAPIEGYDGFSIAQLRGRMRGYALSTVQDLVAYEEATRARAPYLTMLRNRLEKLEEQAVEASPLAPRGA
jgi:hypothetical protein